MGLRHGIGLVLSDVVSGQLQKNVVEGGSAQGNRFEPLVERADESRKEGLSVPGGSDLINLLVFPLVFLAGVSFPVDSVPLWMEVLSKSNPVTYGVDAIRQVLLGADIASGGLGVTVFGHVMTLGEELAIIGGLGFVLLATAVRRINRTEGLLANFCDRGERPQSQARHGSSVQSVMEITCAQCGCLVDQGEVIRRCDSEDCCCSDLPDRS